MCDEYTEEMAESDYWFGDSWWDYCPKEPPPPLPTQWKTRDGQVLLITEMETSHIRNCIRQLETHKPDSRRIEAFKSELARREQER